MAMVIENWRVAAHTMLRNAYKAAHHGQCTKKAALQKAAFCPDIRPRLAPLAG
jgi:hypothetical protein